MKKSTFLPKFHFFFAQNWHFCTKIDIDGNTCHFASKFARHYFITLLGNSLICPKTDDFCIKCDFLLKENNTTKNWHFPKTEDTSLRKLDISIKNWHFWKWWPFAKNMKKSFKIGVSAKIFDFTSEAHITKKINTSKTNCHFFSELTTKILLKPSVIFPKIDN